ncbi:uncharacterized protein LOC126810899 isoform X2 [Patella vulgata]|uniref:uncharacterized protein LOC126810899 isoform X2 n=1 Tax=Patella vulgata TaxID=6465 RepID=UPI00217FC638|nr:uncharacterized protein LOC126810899 isoform X2 [Patella vulgata]
MLKLTYFLAYVILSCLSVEVRGGSCGTYNAVRMCHAETKIGTTIYLESDVLATDRITQCTCTATLIKSTSDGNQPTLTIFPPSSWSTCDYRLDMTRPGISGVFNCLGSTNYATPFQLQNNGDAVNIVLAKDIGPGNEISECSRIFLQANSSESMTVTCQTGVTSTDPTAQPTTTQTTTTQATTPLPTQQQTTQPTTTQPTTQPITTQPTTQPTTTQSTTQPTTTQPPTTTAQPTTTQSTTSMAQPTTMTQATTTMVQATTMTQATTTIAQPTTTMAQSTTTMAQPTTTMAQPTTTMAQPTTIIAQSTTTMAQPTTTMAQPTTTGPQPATQSTTGAGPNDTRDDSNSDLIIPVACGVGLLLLIIALVAVLLIQKSRKKRDEELVDGGNAKNNDGYGEPTGAVNSGYMEEINPNKGSVYASDELNDVVVESDTSPPPNNVNTEISDAPPNLENISTNVGSSDLSDASPNYDNTPTNLESSQISDIANSRIAAIHDIN